MADKTESEVLARYVAQAIELQEQGTEVCFETLCEEHPDLIDTVRSEVLFWM